MLFIPYHCVLKRSLQIREKVLPLDCGPTATNDAESNQKMARDFARGCMRKATAPRIGLS